MQLRLKMPISFIKFPTTPAPAGCEQQTRPMTGMSTMRKRKFSLKLATLTGAWEGLPEVGMGGWADYPEGGLPHFQPGLLDQSFGQRCNYGALFTYLFRRFGLPNQGSDPYKNIASYTLTTPLPELALVVTPSVSDSPRLSFRFYVPEETWRQLEVEPRERWKQAMVEWSQQRGPLPEWAADWLSFWRTKPGVAERTAGDLSDWGLSLADMNHAQIIVTYEDPKMDLSASRRQMLQQVADYIRALQEDFRAIQPHPATRDRAAEWATWPEDDPLKPFYAAAAEALADLATPVRVRDSAINAHGIVTDERLAARARKEPEVAGWPFGGFINASPEDALNLLLHAKKIGGGNLAKGVRKLLPASEGAS